MKERLISVILNPLFIALSITLAIIYFLPDYFTKYKIKLEEQAPYSRKEVRIYFQDLNNDNSSEKIICHKNSLGQACYEIFNSNGDYVDQWNFSSYFPMGAKVLSFLDINNNGYKEIYFITQKLDSAFLNINEPFVKNGINRKKIFIDTIAGYNKEYLLQAGEIKANGVNSEGDQEISFMLNSGFSGYPRNVYKYNFDLNRILKSPHLTNPSGISQIVDLNQDGFKDILLRNYSAGNEIDSAYTKRSDYSSWLNVLDNKLNFLFNPIEFKVPFSSLNTISFKSDNEYKLLCLLNSKQNKVSPNKLFVFSPFGKLIKEKELPIGKYRIFLNPIKDEFILYNRLNGQLLTFNFNLEELASFFIQKNSNYLHNIDIDEDGSKEWLTISHDIITIYRENFKDQISIQLPKSNNTLFHFGLKQVNSTQNQLYFQIGDDYFIYKYSENPFYVFKYVIHLSIFLVIFGLVLLIMKVQKLRMIKLRTIENEISELQIKAIKNQVDPHFVFNAINTISEMTLMDNKMEADDFICRFSDFMRVTLQNSDKISTSLKEELAFVENFIKLQRIRYNNSFDYQFNIDNNINLNTKVPKHVLFSYAENAIKHGLANKATNGLLKIKASLQGKNLLLTVEDNGSGLGVSKAAKKDSTGNGLLIMEKIFSLYSKLYKKKIQHKFTEIFDNQNKKAGVQVEVLISK